MEASELAAIVDEFHRVRETRLAADRTAKALKSSESRLKATIIAELREQGVPVVGGETLTVTLVKEGKPTCQDWPALYAYIHDNDAYDLLEKRLLKSAVKARWEDSENVPGVIEVDVYDLSLSTVRPKRG